MLLGPLLTVLIIIWIVYYVARPYRDNTPRDYNSNQGYSVNKSLEILKERYAKGEITEEEFERIKRNLER